MYPGLDKLIDAAKTSDEDGIRSDIINLRHTLGLRAWLDNLTDEQIKTIDREIISVFRDELKRRNERNRYGDKSKPEDHQYGTSPLQDKDYLDGLIRLEEANRVYRQRKAAFLWRMRKINAESPEIDFQEKITWLRSLGKIKKIQKLLQERESYEPPPIP